LLQFCTNARLTRYIVQRETMSVGLVETEERKSILVELLAKAMDQAHCNDDKLAEIQNECEELELEISRNNDLQTAARDQNTVLKKKATDLKDDLTTAIWTLQEREGEEENLRNQVVSNPTKIKSDLHDTKLKLNQKKAELADKEKYIHDGKIKAANLRQAVKDLKAIMERSSELEAQVVRFKEIVNEMEVLLDKIKLEDKELTEMLAQTNESEHALRRTDETIIAERTQHKLQIEAAHEALDKVKSQLKLVEKDHRETLARREASENEIRQMELEVEEQAKLTDEEIEQMMAEYKVVEEAYLARIDKLERELGVAQ
jgi:chromosome segregation ATPase